MQTVIKNIAVAIGVLIISAGIFYAVSDDRELKELKEDVFNHSLKLLGSQLLAMVANEDHSREVAQRWEIFQERALKGELAPGKIEQVAINILNARNTHEKLSSLDAKMLLDFSMQSGESLMAFKTFKIIVSDAGQTSEGGVLEPPELMPPLPPKSRDVGGRPPFPTPFPKHRFEQLGEEIMAIVEFNRRIEASVAEDPGKREMFYKNFSYKFDDGIKLSADPELQALLQGEEFNEWSEEFIRLKKRKILQWQKNFAMHRAQERERRRAQIDSLRVLLPSHHSKDAELTHEQRLEILGTLERLHELEIIDAEAIRRAIHESMKEFDAVLQDMNEQNRDDQ